MNCLLPVTNTGVLRQDLILAKCRDLLVGKKVGFCPYLRMRGSYIMNMSKAVLDVSTTNRYRTWKYLVHPVKERRATGLTKRRIHIASLQSILDHALREKIAVSLTSRTSDSTSEPVESVKLCRGAESRLQT